MVSLESAVYLGAFVLLWLVLALVEPLRGGQALSLVLVLGIGAASYYLLESIRKSKAQSQAWQAVLVGLMLAEVFFALSFWSTPVRNKALIMLAVIFVFGQWFDRIELKWLILFLIILVGALLLVPFQIL